MRRTASSKVVAQYKLRCSVQSGSVGQTKHLLMILGSTQGCPLANVGLDCERFGRALAATSEWRLLPFFTFPCIITVTNHHGWPGGKSLALLSFPFHFFLLTVLRHVHVGKISRGCRLCQKCHWLSFQWRQTWALWFTTSLSFFIIHDCTLCRSYRILSVIACCCSARFVQASHRRWQQQFAAVGHSSGSSCKAWCLGQK